MHIYELINKYNNKIVHAFHEFEVSWSFPYINADPFHNHS